MATIRYAAPADDDFLRGLCAVPDVRAAFLDPAPGGHAPDDTVNYIIELAGAPVGFLQCTPMHARHPFLAHVPDALRADLSGDRVHSVGYAVHPDWRGRRAATSALRAAVAWHRGMDPECGFYALADRDGASARVLGLCGFRRFHEPGPSGLWTYVYIYFFRTGNSRSRMRMVSNVKLMSCANTRRMNGCVGIVMCLVYTRTVSVVGCIVIEISLPGP